MSRRDYEAPEALCGQVKDSLLSLKAICRGRIILLSYSPTDGTVVCAKSISSRLPASCSEDCLEAKSVFGVQGQGYDTSTGIFSPEGRIFAAEYAKKAVEQGAPSIGILVDEGVILLANKNIQPLQESDSVEKISKIDSHIGVATAGLMADARQLVSEARIKAQSYWLTFEEPVPGEALAEHICDVKANFTQGGGRPYGVSMIIGSVDHDGAPKLFTTDPVGTYWGFLAVAIGRGANKAGEYLEQHYNQKNTLVQAINLALDALRQATDTELNSDNIEIARIPVKTGKFYKLSHNEIDDFLSPTKPKKKA